MRRPRPRISTPANCAHNKVLHVLAGSAAAALVSGSTARFAEIHSMSSYFAIERLTLRGDPISRSSGALTRVRLARKQISKYANVMTGI